MLLHLTTALDSPSLMGMLMQAQMPVWPQGMASVVVNQLFEKYEPHNTFSMINMNRLKQKIGFPTPDRNPQVMFEQIASLENRFKMLMLHSEKIAIAIKKLPPEYQAMLTSEMSKEGRRITPQHIEDVVYQYWRAVHGSYAKNAIIDGKTEEKADDKEVVLMAFNGTCNQCGQQGHKEVDCYTNKHINGHALTPKEGGKSMKGNNKYNNSNSNNKNGGKNKSKK